MWIIYMVEQCHNEKSDEGHLEVDVQYPEK